MATTGVLPLLAGVVSGAFAAFVAREYAMKLRPHQLAWALGLGAYALASLIEAAVSVQGWSVGAYRAYFPLAGATVGLLGAGTILLAARPLVGRAFAAFVLILIAVAAIAPLAVPLTSDALAQLGSDVGAKAIPFSNPGRIAFLLLNILGGLALIGGALWGWWRARRAGVLLIGVGAMMPFAGGSLSTLFALDLRVTLQFVGIVVMFAGYLYGRDLGPREGGRARDAVEA